MEIRNARPDEFEPIGELTVHAYETIEGAGEMGDYASTLRAVGERAAHSQILVAVDGSVVLGAVALVDDPRSPYSEGLRDGECGIRMLAVAPQAQGRGIGRGLTRACLERARAGGCGRVVLHSTPWMTVAHGLYRSLGFERAPDRDVVISDELTLLAFVLDLRSPGAE